MIPRDVLSYYSGRQVLVTGGTGLIGRPVVDLLTEAGAKVTVVSLDDLRPNTVASYLTADLRDFDTCRRLVAGAEFVFHLAGIKGSIDVTRSRPATLFVPYVQFNTNVLEACRVSNVHRVLLTSSIGAYASAEVFKEGDPFEGVPMDFFAGWAKRVAELQVMAYRTEYGLRNFTIVRPCNVYGPGDNFDPNSGMVIPSLMMKVVRASTEGQVEVWGDGSAVRDFAYSRDIAEGILLAMYHSPQVPFLNLGSGIPVTIRQLVDTLQEVVPFRPVWNTAASNGFPKRVMDISLARETIGYAPSTSLRDGLSETWTWFLANQDEYLRRQNYFTDAVGGCAPVPPTRSERQGV